MTRHATGKKSFAFVVVAGLALAMGRTSAPSAATLERVR
jgi:hypothetical protein